MSARDDYPIHSHMSMRENTAGVECDRMLDEIDRLREIEKGLDAHLPACLTCNGTGMEPRNFSDSPCRDCSDGQMCGTGKVSIEKLVGLWTAATDPASDLHNALVNLALDQFIASRSVRADQ